MMTGEALFGTRQLHLVSAKQCHLESFLPDIRPVDNEEWVAGTGQTTRSSISAAIALGRSWAVLDEDGACWALWGVQPQWYLPVGSSKQPCGVAWMVASRKAQCHVYSMHRLFAQGIDDMHAHYHHLEAWAYHRNTLHHKWMERMGWVRSGQVAHFATGLGFIHFTRDAP